MNQPLQQKNKPIIIRHIVNLAFFILIAAMLFGIIMRLTSTQTKFITDTAELSGFDFSSQIAYLSPDVFDRFPRMLLSPEDFENEIIVADDFDLGHWALYAIPYSTYRLVLNLEENQIYGLAGFSTPSAMKLWVDGYLVLQIGTPSDSLESMIPDERFFTVYFMAGAEPTEIIIQRSGFSHASGGHLTPLFLSAQSLIANMTILDNVRIGVMLCIMLVAFLLFFGIFILFPNRRHFLWFSLACLFIFVRILFINHYMIMTMLPSLSWHTKIGIDYISTFGFTLFSFMHINAMFEGKLNRIVKFLAMGVPLFNTVFVLIAPATTYTIFRHHIQASLGIITIIALINVMWLIMKRIAKLNTVKVLTLLGGSLAMFLSIAEIFVRLMGPEYDHINLMQMGMMCFVLANAAALILNFRNAEVELYETKEKEKQLATENAAEQTLSRMKTEFMATMSHELKTPLYVIGGYAEITEWQFDAGTMNEETKEKLRTISLESRRLSQLVDSLMDMSTLESGVTGNICIPAEELTRRAAAICIPILEKNDNKLDLQIEKDCPPVMANPDMILRVIINFVENANRHCNNSVVQLRIENGEMRIKDPMPGLVVFTITDNGEGIPPDILASVFERGVSGDGGSGLGLSICKEAVEAHGGTIDIDSELDKGTRITFTLPAGKIES